jgi:5-formyltetrahydrofolate cyclo-ligase
LRFFSTFFRSGLSTSIETTKSELRQVALARRDSLPAAERAGAAEALAARAFPIAVAPGQTVAGFMPIKGEINPLPLMRRLAAMGACLALPAIAGRGRPLVLRAYTIGEELVAGTWGIREPKAAAREVVPDIMLVPLLAFDRAGGRVGYGAGYYDLTIAAARAAKPVAAVGVAFAVQEFPHVPSTARDVRLDLVLTERETIECRACPGKVDAGFPN